MLFGAAVRTSLRLLFCCILHPLGLPLFAALDSCSLCEQLCCACIKL